ncbi:MAG TPA: type II toxin-antitoxin system RelE/ParE family toxin [Chitinophagaceae bacterium]|nr:type II toxin-antitoxin system RelE/ParE family toxin [Chitinophagaceae bacterium]
MVRYQLKIKRSAEKELANFPTVTILAIKDRILTLRSNPFPNGYKKLKGFKNLYRIRSGNYRIIYSVQNDVLIVEILKIVHRKDAYS